MNEVKKYNLGLIAKSRAMNHVTENMKKSIAFELSFIDQKTGVLHKITHSVEKQETKTLEDGSVWKRIK